MSPNRADLAALVDRLSREVRDAGSLRDQLPLVRAYLAAVDRLEALDAATLAEARRAAREAGSGPVSGPPGPVDELLARRRRRA